ncbi:MAG: ion transporter [Planctomycetes bacterium]|nr:ion transporter [Planctomycetota bacterium]
MVEIDHRDKLKNRLGALVHHSTVSFAIAILIVLSVSLVVVHFALPLTSPLQTPIEIVQWVITAVFVVELSLKAYVAPSRSRFLAQYWIDIIATLPWTQSLRALRVLRLLRVFRVAVIFSRRIRFVSNLFRSAIGEYIVLGLMMLTLLSFGTFALWVTENRAREKQVKHQNNALSADLLDVEVPLGLAAPKVPGQAELVGIAPTTSELHHRFSRAERELHSSKLKHREHERIAQLLARIHTRLPKQAGRGHDSSGQDLAEFENSFWATTFFLVATEPMIDVPRTNIGRFIVLAVMFGGLTTFALFTGIVTALMVNRLKRRMEIDDMDRFQLNDHIVICGWNRLVPLIIDEIGSTPSQRDTAVVVVADLDEAPEAVTKAREARLYFVRGDYTKPETLEQARIPYAKRAIIVADTTIPQRSDQDRDARTVLAALMIERMQPEIYTCAELLNPDNEVHLRAAGIEEVVVTSEAGGHHLAMAALHFGLANVLNELMTGKVGDTLRKLTIPPDYVGITFIEAVERYKREKNALLIGVEIAGQDGPRAEGYAMRLNPESELTLGERDNLVVIGAAH